MNYTKKGPGDFDDERIDVDSRDWLCLKCDEYEEDCQCEEPEFVANDYEPPEPDPDDGEVCGQYWNP